MYNPWTNTLEQAFKNLDIRQESISNCAQLMLSNTGDLHTLILIFRKCLISFLESRSQSQNVLAMFYVMNEVLYSLNGSGDTFSLDVISNFFDEMIDTLKEAALVQKYAQSVLKVMLIWKEKRLLEARTIDRLVGIFQTKVDENHNIELERIDFDYSHLKKYAKKYLNCQDWKKRLDKVEESLRTIDNADEETPEKVLKMNERAKCIEMVQTQENELERLKASVNSRMHSDFIRIVQDIKRIDNHIDEVQKLIKN